MLSCLIKIRIDWTMMDSALKEYAAEVAYEDVSIMAPCFLTDIDVASGAATEGNILFGLTTWVSGHKNTQPSTVETSAYEVVDELINYYMDKEKFPALEAVVFAGHSAGGQMTQRYAALKNCGSSDEDRLHYWVGNPGSLVWLTEDRPIPNEACERVDSYKYGLNDTIPAYALAEANELGRDGLIGRYMGRKIHYAFGLADNGAGDTRCQAQTQGMTHLERGQNFMSMVDGLGGLRETSTVDYVPDVSHNPDLMVKSAQGLEKVYFLLSFTTGEPLADYFLSLSYSNTFEAQHSVTHHSLLPSFLPSLPIPVVPCSRLKPPRFLTSLLCIYCVYLSCLFRFFTIDFLTTSFRLYPPI